MVLSFIIVSGRGEKSISPEAYALDGYTMQYGL